MATHQPEDRLQQSFEDIARLLERHRVLEALAHQQDSPRRDLIEQLQHRQNVAELGKRLRLMHAADIAHVLEGLPLDDRTMVWREVAPEQAGDVFVDVRHVLRGGVPLPVLLVSEPATPITDLMREQVVIFNPMDDARSAVGVFERYDLVSAPVIDNRGKLVGRLTVDAVMDVLRDESSRQALRSAGLSKDEDLFASLWDSARNRWPWLAINLVTAFIASRVIGQFEGVIQQLAALAALMPIVASIGGNTGNQTMALVIRSLATGQIQPERSQQLLTKELSIGVLNGSVWGLIVGAFAVIIYGQIGLGLVMTGAVGFFLFLGLARVFLV